MVGSSASSEVDVVRRGYDLWNERDADALTELFSEDAEIHSAVARAEGEGVYRGREGVREWLRNVVDTVGFVMEPTQFLSYRGFVLSLVVAHARGPESGIDVDQEYGLVHEVRAGKIRLLQSYLDPAEAIEAMARLSGRGRSATVPGRAARRVPPPTAEKET